jgi:DNA-binding response OmpR family regulator
MVVLAVTLKLAANGLLGRTCSSTACRIGACRLPRMNGFELCEKIFAIDINVRVCFMSSVEINREGLREIYPSLILGCFIRKPVNIDYLLERIRSELD